VRKTILLSAILLASVAGAQSFTNFGSEFLPIPQAVIDSVEITPAPEGQMRIMIHWHTTASDGLSSPQTSVLWAKKYGAEALFFSDHAHVLGREYTELDLYNKGFLHYKIAVKKPVYNGASYYDLIRAVQGMPVGAWLEVGEESHFLVCPGFGDDIKEVMDEVVKLGCRTKELGTQAVIEQIAEIITDHGGFIIMAHPMNPSYPFNYNFDRVRCPVGVEFFNGARKEHWENWKRLLEVQRHSAFPAIATDGNDVHIPSDTLTELASVVGNAAAEGFFKDDLDELRNYRQSKRFTYVIGKSQNPTVIACQIRDASEYCAYGSAQVVDWTSVPGTRFCPPRGQDVFYVKCRVSQDVKTMRAAFVDDETTEVTEIEVPLERDYVGLCTGQFSVNKLRKDPSHSGKLLMATTEWVTGAVIILADPRSVALKIAEIQAGLTPKIESPAVSLNPVQIKPEAKPAVQSSPPDFSGYEFRFHKPVTEGDLDVEAWFGFNRELKGRIYIIVGGGPNPIDLPLQIEFRPVIGCTAQDVFAGKKGASAVFEAKPIFRNWSTNGMTMYSRGGWGNPDRIRDPARWWSFGNTSYLKDTEAIVLIYGFWGSTVAFQIRGLRIRVLGSDNAGCTIFLGGNLEPY